MYSKFTINNGFICRKRVFILGPSHHYGLPGCALTKTVCYKTPLYDLTIDTDGKSCFNDLSYLSSRWLMQIK